MEGLNLISSALRLEGSAFTAVMSLPHLRIALIVVFLAGLSNSLGQSVVLFVNKVKPRRFIASLVLGGILYVLGFLFYAFSVWLVEQFLFERDASFRSMVKVVGLAYSPYLFSFFILTPYFGSFISVALSLWSLAAILIALIATLNLTIWQALTCSVLGWLLLQILGRTIGRPLQALTLLTKRITAGTRLELSPKQLLDPKERS